MPRLLPQIAALCVAVSCTDPKTGGEDGPESSPASKAAPADPGRTHSSPSQGATTSTRPVNARDRFLSSKGLAGAAPIPFTTVTADGNPLLGHYSGLDEELAQVVGDQASFARLFALVFSRNEPVPSPPEIDFAKHSVIAVALGTRNSGGYRIEIESLVEQAGQIHVIVREREPGPGEVVTLALTQPYHVVATRRLAPESVRFHRYQRAGD